MIKYDKNIEPNIKNRDATKIKYVINKLNKLANGVPRNIQRIESL